MLPAPASMPRPPRRAGLACALALVAAAGPLAAGALASPGAAAAGPFPQPARASFAVAEEALLGAGGLVVSAGPGGIAARLGPAPEHLAYCGGDAPLVSDCASGQHPPPAGFWEVGFALRGCAGILFTQCYVGDLQLVMTAVDGSATLIHHCVAARTRAWVQVTWLLDCRTEGSVDPAQPFDLRCHARAFTTSSPAEPGSGAPGGAGTWECFYRHE